MKAVTHYHGVALDTMDKKQLLFTVRLMAEDVEKSWADAEKVKELSDSIVKHSKGAQFWKGFMVASAIYLVLQFVLYLVGVLT